MKWLIGNGGQGGRASNNNNSIIDPRHRELLATGSTILAGVNKEAFTISATNNLGFQSFIAGELCKFSQLIFEIQGELLMCFYIVVMGDRYIYRKVDKEFSQEMI